MAEPTLHDGWVDAEVAQELPGLALRWMAGRAADPRSPRALQQRLRAASDRLIGARAVTMRREAVPAAYRAFLRGVGVDPDVRRSPIEQAALEDAARVRVPLGIRPRAHAVTSGPGEGELVVADVDGPVAVLLGEVDPALAPARATREVLVWAVQVPGVPDVHVEEALWTVHEALGTT